MKAETDRLMSKSMGFTSSQWTLTPWWARSPGRETRRAIVRALFFDAEIIILDEPTMGLSLKETAKLVSFVRGIREAGKSAVFIDHNIVHVYDVADRIVVIDRAGSRASS